MENLQLENYFSRLKEVLKVHGKLNLNDLEYCKLLTEREVVNNFLKPDVSKRSEQLCVVCSKNFVKIAVDGCCSEICFNAKKKRNCH